MLSKDKTIKVFCLNQQQIKKIDQYIFEIQSYNKHVNIVGSSTLVDPWKSHVIDSMQIGKFVKNNHDSILDMGTGAGIPGIILAINNFKNVNLIDSNMKKIKFVELVCLKLNINAKIYHKRIERLLNKKFKYLVSRALANLNKLFFYSQNFLDKDTVLIFLKGKQVKYEIHEANKHWKFHHEIFPSISDKRGSVLVIRGLSRING